MDRIYELKLGEQTGQISAGTIFKNSANNINVVLGSGEYLMLVCYGTTTNGGLIIPGAIGGSFTIE